MITKPQLRKEIAEKRAALAPRWQKAASIQIQDTLQTVEAFDSAEIIALYMAISGEVDLDAFFQKCWKQGKRTCIPVFNAPSNRYEMAEVTDKTPYCTGHYGIKEPTAPTLIPMETLDLITVPGVAFDRSGNRLGRGGGYYDRLLDGFKGVSVAVAFDFQLLPHIPSETHDKPVDILVTEAGILMF